MAVPFQEHRRVWERPSRPGWGAPPGTPAWEVKPWRPLATWWLLGIIGATFILQWVVVLLGRAGFEAPAWPSRLGDVPWDLVPGGLHSFIFTVGPDWPWRPWTLVTSTFSHSTGSIWHILFNGLMLYSFGPMVERLIGRKRFVILFLAGGALSGIVQSHVSSLMMTGGATAWQVLLVQGNELVDVALALGASGALMVLFGVLIVLTPRAKFTTFIVFIPVTMQMWVAGIVFALLDTLGIFAPDQIGHFAHLSGLALGLAYGWWAKEDLKRRGLRVVDPGAPPESPWMRR
jgi:uncharacterized protein